MTNTHVVKDFEDTLEGLERYGNDRGTEHQPDKATELLELFFDVADLPTRQAFLWTPVAQELREGTW